MSKKDRARKRGARVEAEKARKEIDKIAKKIKKEPTSRQTR